jgi:FkbM family methyltransferase
MGLRRTLREMLLRRRLPVPPLLVKAKERPLYEELNRLRPGAVVLDLGANVGRTVRLFAGRGARVEAYEPNPDAFAVLERATAGLPGVRLHPVAVGDADGEAQLYRHHDYRPEDFDHLESSSLIAEKGNVDAARAVTVPVRDVAQVVAEADAPVDLMKIDVEGAEYAILRRLILSGAIDRVARVAVETHADRIESLRPAHAEIESLIAERGLADKIRFGWE